MIFSARRSRCCHEPAIHIIRDEPAMNEHQARDEICRVGKSLFERGYVHATAGNIRMRLEDADGGGTLITPTDACLADRSG